MSTAGHVTAVGKGAVNVQATIGTLKSSWWTVTIGSPAVTAAVQPAATAAVPAAVPATAKAVDAVAAAVEPAPVAAFEPAAPGTNEAAAGPAAPSDAPATTGSAVVAGPIPAAPGPAQPDEFLGPFWNLAMPSGGSASISNSHLFIGVPGGSNHDSLHSSNQAIRVIQAIGNDNFDVAIKIDSPLTAGDANTSQGLMVLADNQDFVTFSLETNGTNIGLSAYTVTGGVATAVLEDSDFGQYQNPMYLRLTKTGSAYVAMYSVDGANWAQAVSFTYLKPVTQIGPFASNYNDTPAKAVPVVMSVNWFDVLQQPGSLGAFQ